MKDSTKLFSGNVGMDRDTHPSTLKKEQYTFAKNILYEETSGGGFLVQNEPSNIKCIDFPSGFQVIGYESNYYDNYTLYFLFNKESSVSMVGKVPFSNYNDDSDDERLGKGCKGCERVESLDTTQEYCKFIPIISDECDDTRCLNFSLEYPFKRGNIQIKKEKCGVIAYLTDFNNPPRYINLSNVEQYKYIKEDACTDIKVLKCEDCDQNEYVKCPNCDLMRVFPLYKEANLKVEKVSYGGNLPQGSYEIFIAYSDIRGNEVSGYFSKTPSARLFDTNNVSQSMEDFDRNTGYGLRINIDNLDQRFKYYKVAIIYRAPLSGHKEGTPMQVLSEGVHPTTDRSILIYDLRSMTPIALNDITIPSVSYDRTEMITAGNGYLFHGGIVPSREINLQPIFNLMGAFLEWRTIQSMEGLYSDAANTSKYGTYLRDEIYPFSGRIKIEGGYTSRNFILVNRPPTIEDADTIDDRSTKSVNRAYKCETGERKHRWEFYSTATDRDLYNKNSQVADGVKVQRDVEKSCVEEIKEKLNDLVIYLPDDLSQSYELLADYIFEKEDIIRQGTEGFNDIFPEIHNVLSHPNNYVDCEVHKDKNCLEPILQSSEVILRGIGDETVEQDLREASEYIRSSNDTQDYLSQSSDGVSDDDAFLRSETAEKKIKDSFPLFTNVMVYQRSNVSNNYTLQKAIELEVKKDGDFSFLNKMLRAKASFSSSLEAVQSSVDATPDNTYSTDDDIFLDKLAKYSYWYKVEVTDDVFGVEVAQTSEFSEQKDFFMRTNTMRVSTYSYDGSSLIQISHNVDKIVDGTLIELNRDNYNGGVAYVAIDFPISFFPSPVGTIAFENTPWIGLDVKAKAKQYKNRRYVLEYVSFAKKQTYNLSCDFYVSEGNGCVVSDFKHGDLGYYESTSKYPCNDEMFNSSKLRIEESKVPDKIKDKFEEFFVEDSENGIYTLKEDTDLRDKNIRHYRFPDNSISPFMGYELSLPFQESKIYPIGIYIEPDIVNFFLDLAVDNNLLTQDERDRIYELELFRGDRSLYRSIVAKGLGYDMYSYDKQGSKYFYPNYPYNDLGEDSLHCTDSGRAQLIKHPFYLGREGNNKFTFHSADTHFYRPVLGNELFIEGYQYGASRGKFSEVEGHPKWVLLGKKAYKTSSLLATAEALLVATSNIADLVIKSAESYRVYVGTSSSVNAIGIGLSTTQVAVLAGMYAAQQFLKIGEYRFEWLKVFYDNGKPKNFSSFYSSVGFYNKFGFQRDDDNRLRGINKSHYLLSGSHATTDTHSGGNIIINNKDREESVYLSLNDVLFYNDEYALYDNGGRNKGLNSRFIASESTECEELQEVVRNIASPYFSIKNWQKDLFGEIYDINWVRAGALRLDGNETDKVIFGGDNYITRLSLKRKTPIYAINAIGASMDVPFQYSKYSNIGYPRFYIDFNSGEKAGVSGALFPEIRSFYDETDCLTGQRDTYVKNPTKIYLFYYGIPQFLVESDINVDYRYAGKRKEQVFYPHTGDYIDWTQELNVSIKEPNYFLYNPVYTQNTLSAGSNMLPIDYNRVDYECFQEEPNGVIYSLQDNSEQTYYDPNLYYRPLDNYEFKSQGGKLIDLTAVQSEQVFARFENHVSLFNAVDTLRDRLKGSYELIGKGTGGIFQERAIDSIITTLGYGGTQHKEHVSCEFGVFFPDMRRGQVFQMDFGGQGIKLNEITKGLRNWFKEHLPFKIMNGGVANLSDLDLDNKFKSLGIAMGWDSRFKRVFLTKKDYKVKSDYQDSIVFVNKKFYYGNEEIELTNTEYFEDVSFTLAYSPLSKSWVAYYDFKPNYYVDFHNYFQTGINSSEMSSSVWSHLLTNKSYTTFYGEKYPWLIELSLQNEMTTDVLRGITYWMDSVRYHNYFDKAENRVKGFNKAWIYNRSINSGQLNLITKERNNLYQELQYPKFKGISTDILVTGEDKHWNINTFYNRIENEFRNIPMWIKDENDIDMSLNPDAICRNHTWMDRMRGDWFLLRLQSEDNNDYKQIFKWGTSDVRRFM